MPAPHTLLELRTGRDADHTPEAAAQLFATLPNLKNSLWHRLLSRQESLSFEIVAQNQTIYFLARVPTRLTTYLQSVLQSSYPEIVIRELEYDPVMTFLPDHQDSFSERQGKFTSMGKLVLQRSEQYPLRTYQDFTDIDPLATTLSTLAKVGPYDTVVIQMVVSQASNSSLAEATGLKSAAGLSGTTQTTQEDTSLAQLLDSRSQRQLSTKKGKSQGLKASIRIVTRSDSKEQSTLLLENIAAAFQAMTQNASNSLALRRPHFFANNFLKAVATRSTSGKRNHLNLDELATLFHLPNAKLASIPNIAWGKTLLGEPPENLPAVSSSMSSEEKREINPFARVGYKNTPTVYGLKRSDRRRHLYVIGKTGTGKSTLLANMAINDLKSDEGMCVIDPHGDLVETLLDYIPSHRINDVVYLDPADPERTVRLNLFEGEHVQHRELIASGIVSVFQKLYSYSWGPRLEYILRNALLTLLQSDQAKMSDIVEILTDAKFRKNIVDKLDDTILKNFWLNEFEKMPDRQRTEAIAPILNKVGQFVSSPLVRDVVNAPKSSFSIEDVMDQGKILLVNLSQGKLGEDNATLLGAMLITKIQLAAMSRVHMPEEQRRDFYLYVDEFQNFATDSFTKILSEARKYRLNLTLANQYIAQIPEAVQKAIFGNCGTMISFVMGSDDAQVFSKEYGDAYSTDDLVSLGRHQIINKITIDNIVSRPFPAETLPLASSSNGNREKVLKVSGERYAKKKK